MQIDDGRRGDTMTDEEARSEGLIWRIGREGTRDLDLDLDRVICAGLRAGVQIGCLGSEEGWKRKVR